MKPDQQNQNTTVQQPKQAETANPEIVVGDLSSKPKSDKPRPEQQPIKPKKKSKKIKRSLKLVFYLLVIGLLSLAFWNRQNLLDWYALRNYQPTADIVRLADDSFMSEYGRRLFYINDPKLQTKKDFYKSCENSEIVVLGCYKPLQGIYVLKVTEEQLAGIEEVTAAHEMLHAAYDRLSYNEKQRINQLLNDTYSNLSKDSIKEKISLYQENGADINNELHSILGTEVADLPAELEVYYQQYFNNRSGVVALSDQFQNVFTSRRLKVEELDKQLASIEHQVKTNNQKLLDLEAAINQEALRLEELLSQNKIEQYNAAVTEYNNSLVPYRQLQSETRNLIAQYKQILAERNRIALEVQELNKPLDSSISTPSSDL